MLHSTLDIVVRILTLTSLIFSPILPSATVSASPIRHYERETQGVPNPWPDQAAAAEQPGVDPPLLLASQDVLDGDTLTRAGDFSIEAQSVSRVTEGLQVLYMFEEGGGTTIDDDSGVGTPLDLTIADENAVSWGTNYLSIDSATIASSGVAATKVIGAAKASNEITIEAWLKPANTTQDGPARVISLSEDYYNRNFTVG